MYQSIFKPLNLGIHELGHVIFTPFGGEEILHDWNYLLGKLGLLNSDTVLGGFVKALAILNMVIGLAFGAWLLLKMFKKRR